MNTKNKWTTTATIRDPERGKFWLDVMGGDTVPIVSMMTQRVKVPGRGEVDAYMLDLKAISDEQRERLIQAIAIEFRIPLVEVRAEIDDSVPVLAENVYVSSSDPGLFFSMLGDDDERDMFNTDQFVDEYLDYEED